MRTSWAFAAVLDELAELVAAKVLAKLSAPTSHYSTASRSGTLPPGKSRAWALRTLKLVPGARKVGRDWVVSVADFEAWAAEKDSERLARSGIHRIVRDTPSDVAALVEQGLRESGFRNVRAR